MSGAQAPSSGPPPPVVAIAGSGRFSRAADAALAGWAEALAAELAPEHRTFAIRFVGDRTMRRWNRDFRGKDETTDVLSFPGDQTPEGLHLGDVAICVPQAERQAREHGHALGRELRLLVLHGMLHCLGYDHETDQGEMERLERRLRRRHLRDA